MEGRDPMTNTNGFTERASALASKLVAHRVSYSIHRSPNGWIQLIKSALQSESDHAPEEAAKLPSIIIGFRRQISFTRRSRCPFMWQSAPPSEH